MKISTKIIALPLSLVLISITVIAIAVTVQIPILKQKINKEIRLEATSQTERIVDTLYAIYDVTNMRTEHNLARNLEIAKEMLVASGGLTITDEHVNWAAVNQETKKSQSVSLPRVRLGGQWLDDQDGDSKGMSTVSFIRKYTGAECTIFQRMNEAGDMIRVATTVTGEKGAPAIGTYIPHTSQVVQTVLSGKTYFGRAFVVKEWQTTAYEPIYNSDGAIIGMLFVGVNLADTVKELVQTVDRVRVGTTGYAYVLQATGTRRGMVIAHKDKELIGTSIWESKDASGNFIIQNLIDTAVKASGRVVVIEYPWQNIGEHDFRLKVAACAYFAPWDVVIGAGMYYDDLSAVEKKVTRSFQALLLITICIGGIIFICSAVIGLKVTGKITRKLKEVADFSRRVGKGELGTRLDINSKEPDDELAEMARALNKMADDIQTKNDELMRFTYTVSHDLKSPIVTIRTFLGYAEEGIKKGNAERVKEDFEYIRNAAEKMGILLDELLELSRIGRKTNPLQKMTLQEVADEAAKLVAGGIAEHNVQIAISKIPAILCGDRARVIEIFQNLIDNAVKFMGDQPSPRIDIGVSHSGGEDVFFVRDNGMGIDPKYQKRLFGLFEKLNPASKGTGMGLALTKRIIEVHGGKIWIESEGAGKGTTFYFTLPGTIL